MLAFRHFQLLKLKHDKPLSNFACFGFNCKLRPSTLGVVCMMASNSVVEVSRRYDNDPACAAGFFSTVGRCRFTPGLNS